MKKCKIEECEGKYYAKEYCRKHYRKITRPNRGSWRMMMHRCYNPNNAQYKDYGGRGITVCEEWHDVKKYCKYWDNKEKPSPDHNSKDRIDNDGNYCPENCRWATSKMQADNKRERGLSRNNTSGVNGVYWDTQRNKWRAEVRVKGKKCFIGRFNTVAEAENAIKLKSLKTKEICLRIEN